jgi:hypothetical protein
VPRGSKPGERRGGRQAGTPNKVTQDLVARLEELRCDPLELSAKIANGQELDGPHPALKAFYKFRDDLAKLQDKGAAVTPDHIDQLTKLIDGNLTRGYVPIELRSKHIADLMQYTYPKRRAVEVDANIHDKRPPNVDPKKLSNEALDQLLAARTGEAVGTVIDGEIDDDD